MAKGKLTPKQERFIAEYLVHSDATRAALAAGYSPKSAGQLGYQLLQNPIVKAKLTPKQEKTLQKLELTAERILEELTMLAFYDPADVALCKDENGEPLEIKQPADIAKLPIHIRKAVVGWSWDRNNNFTLKFAPKQATLNLLGQHFKLWSGEGDDALKQGLAALIQEGRQRAREAQSETRH